jgi:AcrR family transcriptional regulator
VARAKPTSDVAAAEARIMAATLRALTRLDPGALTIQAICQEAGVTAPTLYYHYGSKDGLLAAAVVRLADDWTTLLDTSVPRRGDLDETLATVEQGWEAMICSPDRPLAVLAWVTLLASESSDRARVALVRARDRSSDLVREALSLHLHDEQLAGDLASVVTDALVAAALDHLLDRDAALLRQRLRAITRTVRASVAAAAPA